MVEMTDETAPGDCMRQSQTPLPPTLHNQLQTNNNLTGVVHTFPLQFYFHYTMVELYL